MAIDKVKEYFKGLGLLDRVQEFEVSSATVELAAKAAGVEMCIRDRLWMRQMCNGFLPGFHLQTPASDFLSFGYF